MYFLLLAPVTVTMLAVCLLLKLKFLCHASRDASIPTVLLSIGCIVVMSDYGQTLGCLSRSSLCGFGLGLGFASVQSALEA